MSVPADPVAGVAGGNVCGVIEPVKKILMEVGVSNDTGTKDDMGSWRSHSWVTLGSWV